MIVIDSGVPTESLSLPHLWIHDHVKGSSISADHGEAAHLGSLVTYSAWAPETLPAEAVADFGELIEIDYVLAFVKEPDGCDFRLAYHDGLGWVDMPSPVSLDGPDVIIWMIPKVYAERVRVTVAGTGAPEVAVLKAGLVTVFPEGVQIGHAPARINPREDLVTVMSEGAQILGSSKAVRTVYERVTIPFIDDAWVNGTWKVVRRERLRRGVGWCWSPAEWPGHAIYGQISDSIEAPYSDSFYHQLTFAIQGPEHVL